MNIFIFHKILHIYQFFYKDYDIILKTSKKKHVKQTEQRMEDRYCTMNILFVRKRERRKSLQNVCLRERNVLTVVVFITRTATFTWGTKT